MGDAENTLPPSKKRAAGRELSRDNPGLDDDEEAPEQETGTFKRASDEVLANRRIVKVRRNQTPSAPSAPSSNPFAAIRLVPPPDSAAAPATGIQDTQKAASPEEVESKANPDPETEKGDNEGEKPEMKADVDAKENVSDDAEAAKAKEETETEAKKETENKGDKNDDETKNTESVNSFQQLSSSQNAFTGLVGTGFSSSTFSFGSIAKTDTFPSFSFGTNGNSPLFGNSGASGASNKTTDANKTPSLQEVQVETGEENEKAVFSADSALFEFIDGGWKERGKGELKVNVPTTTTGPRKARMVMRARGNYRLILNAGLFPEMKLTNMEKKGVTFACLNSTGEGKDGLSTFALKFRDAAIVEEFRAVVVEYKGNTVAAAAAAAAVPVLRTPENSPKASDE